MFSTNRDGNSEIYKMNADGTGQVNLTNNPMTSDNTPEFAPDGGIAFTKDTGGNDIWIMNGDGSGQTNLTATNLTYDSIATRSPDGTKIAFTQPPRRRLRGLHHEHRRERRHPHHLRPRLRRPL